MRKPTSGLANICQDDFGGSSLHFYFYYRICPKTDYCFGIATAPVPYLSQLLNIKRIQSKQTDQAPRVHLNCEKLCRR